MQQAEGTHDVGTGKGEGVFDAAVDVALGCQVDDAVDVVLSHYLEHLIEVADIGAHEGVVGSLFYVFEIGQVAGIGQLVKVDDVVLGILVDEEAHYVRAYEAGSAGDEDMSCVGIHCYCYC